MNSSASTFATMPGAAQWTFLAALSGACAALLHLAGLPAAFFLGPMAAGVIMGANGASIRCSARALHRRASHYGGVHRERDHSFHSPLLHSGLADYSWRRFRDHRRQQLSRLGHEPLARHAGHDRRLGLVAGRRRRHGDHGCGIWRRRAARRLHAIFSCVAVSRALLTSSTSSPRLRRLSCTALDRSPDEKAGFHDPSSPRRAPILVTITRSLG